MPRTPLDAAKAQITAYNEKNWDAVRDVLHPDCVYDEVATNRRTKGHDDILAVWKGWAAAFPDSRGSFDGTAVGGDAVTMELTWRGTHTGPLRTPDGETAPTGKRIEIRACQVVQVGGDRVSSIRHYFDMATLLRQLGL
ncbi:MAG TPA: ester cyclase [Gemmatimonadota bacterium]|jgi:steroid delta-isomerase-like uncharacterized protein